MICHSTTTKERCLIHHRQAVFNCAAKTDKFLWEESTREGMAVILSKLIAYKHNYFYVSWSWLHVTQNRNASKMRVPWTLLEVQSWVLTTCMLHKMEMKAKCGSLKLSSRYNCEYSQCYLCIYAYIGTYDISLLW